jgi:predicted secreted protein
MVIYLAQVVNQDHNFFLMVVLVILAAVEFMAAQIQQLVVMAAQECQAVEPQVAQEAAVELQELLVVMAEQDFMLAAVEAQVALEIT